MEINNRCDVIMSLWLKSVVEISSVYSSDQKRFPVMKILFVGVGGGMLLSLPRPPPWLVSLGLVFSSPSSTLLPVCPKDHALSG